MLLLTEACFAFLHLPDKGKEGLDIPKVDLVVFYEPIPSAIRQIQRRGRTGRQEKGRVIILVTRDTRDEVFRWVAHHKEKRMHRILKTLKSKLKLTPIGQRQLEWQTERKEKY